MFFTIKHMLDGDGSYRAYGARSFEVLKGQGEKETPITINIFGAGDEFSINIAQGEQAYIENAHGKTIDTVRGRGSNRLDK